MLVFGATSKRDGAIKTDPLLSKIYMFSLASRVHPGDNNRILDIDVPDEHVNALKATLLGLSRARWMQVYSDRIPFAGPLSDALVAEQKNVNEACDSILNDLGFDPAENPK